MIAFGNAERLASLLSELETKKRVPVDALIDTFVAAKSDLSRTAGDSPAGRTVVDRVAKLVEETTSDTAARSTQEVPLEGLFSRSPTARIPIPFPGLEQPRRGLDDPLTLGPFRDLGGLDRSFGLTPKSDWQALVSERSGVPLVLVPHGAAVEDGDTIVLSVANSTIWVALPAFTGSGDREQAKRMVALPAKHAEGKFASAGRLTVKEPLSGRLSIRLDFPDQEIEVCQGVFLRPPEEIHLNWKKGKLSVELKPGETRIGDTEMTFKPTGDPPVYDPELEQLIVPAKSSRTEIDLEAFPHRIASIKGQADVLSAGWAFPVTDPPSPGRFPASKPVGGWLMRLRGEVRSFWPGLSGSAVGTECVLQVSTDGWFLRGDAATTDLVQQNEAWELPNGQQHQPIVVDLPKTGLVSIGCSDQNGDFVAFLGTVEGPFSHPISTLGTPFAPNRTNVSAIFTENADGPRHYALRALSAAGGPKSRFVIENAMIEVERPSFDTLEAEVSENTQLINGSMRTTMRVSGWLPILPDPYVSNLQNTFISGSSAPIAATVFWQDEDASVAFSGDLPNTETPFVPRTQHRPKPIQVVQNPPRPGSLTAEGRVLRSERQQAEIEKARGAAQESSVAPQTAEGEGEVDKLTDSFRRPRIRLLDVSTNRDQIGVEFLPKRNPVASPFRLSGMRTMTPLRDVRVFALPQIQWEPVRTLPTDQDIPDLGWFPTPLASADDGGPTSITSVSTKLSPTIPDLHLGNMVDAFKDGEPANVLTTLPFGIVAYMQLRAAATSENSTDSMSILRPKFSSEQDFSGALQLVLEAGDSFLPDPKADKAFSGLAYQRANGVDLITGQPENISVLGQKKQPNDGAVEALFNQEFTLQRPKVPVKRLDICGYGASSFSDWRNPSAAFAEAAKVEFQVMVGRTALEVIKFVSVLYPWGIRLTRSVTIERGAGAGILRRDSGWQACSDGLLDFTYQPEAGPLITSVYEVHPGLIRGIYDVRRVRTADRPAIDLSDGGRVLPMYFDAEIEIGTETENRRTPFTGVLGYLHLSPIGAPVSLPELTELLETHGAAGGAIEEDLPIDASKFSCRILRAEIGAAMDGANPALVGALRSVPRFGTSGSWSVAAFEAPPGLPEAGAVSDGVPIIREGEAGAPVDGRINVPAASRDIRFADAEDLFKPHDPERSYVFVQSAPTHVFAYRRPSISIGAQTIKANQAPLFADVFARTTVSGLVPEEDDSIVLPLTTVLRVDPSTGWLALNAPIATAVGRPPVDLADEGDVAARVDYTNASLAFDIQPTTWMVNMPGMRVTMDVFSASDVTGMAFDLRGGSATQNQIDNIDTLMHPALEDFLTFIPGFSNREKLPPIDLGATNGLKAKVKTVGSIKKDIVPKYLAIKLSATFESGTDEITIPSDPSGGSPAETKVVAPFVGGNVAAELRGAIPVSFGQVVYGCMIELGGKLFNPVTIIDPSTGNMITTGTLKKGYIELKAYIGLGFKGEAGPFKAKYVVAIGPVVRYDGDWAYGGVLIIDAYIGVIIVEVYFYLEAQLLIKKQSGNDILLYEAEVGLNVKVCFFLSIKMSVVLSGEREL